MRLESVLTPQWSPDGTLHWVSDVSGWWNLYALHDAAPEPVCADSAEYAVPPWQYGGRGYGFLTDGSIVAVRIRDAVHQLVRIDPAAGTAQPLLRALTWIADGHLSCHASTVALAGATPTAGPSVLAVDARGGAVTTIAADQPSWDPSLVSCGTRLDVITAEDGSEIHGFWYKPALGSNTARPPGAGHP